ncbi:MAG: VanW family protein [Candidatus Pacebacteria bacterium]|nr:VanW family protein [Candidatus Paceibacterota bacterium]
MKKKIIKKTPIKKNQLIFIATILVIIFSISGYFFNLNNQYQNKLLPNISINGENYSNFTQSEITNNLENKIKNFRENGIEFIYKENNYQASLSDLGIYINTQKAISTAFEYGHKENIFENIKDHLTVKNVNIMLDTEIDQENLEKYISENLATTENQPIDFSYQYEKDKFVPILSQPGMVIDKEDLKRTISKNISSFQNNPIEIKLIAKDPKIREDKNNLALLSAENLIEKKIELKYNESFWEVQKEDFALWLKFTVINNSDNSKSLGIKINEEKVKDYLLTLVPQINREPIDALLEFKNGKIEMFALSQEGLAIQIEKSIEEINRSVFNSEIYSDNSQKSIVITMITEKVLPTINTESIDNMGITTLLATGESNFAGSPNNRRHNITVGAAKFQGVLIGPEDIFSFNEALGDVGPKEGYLPELVIKQGETIPEYGGGLCQVSTTAFRTAVLAGLEVTERKNHAYAVSYYAPQGTDATIYPPHPDLSFKNNTPAYILIQTKIEGNKLYFDFYGSDDGRKVQTKGPVIYDRQSDGSMKSVWTQQVYDKNEELMFEDKFYSIYKSPALYPHKNPLE